MPQAPLLTEITHDAVNEALLPLISPGTLRILDIGCGTGTLGGLLKSHDPNRVVVGITISPQEAEQAAQRLDAVHLLNLNREDIPAELGTFDAIICSHVIGYFLSAEEVLRRLRRVLTPETGVLIAAIPNVVHWRQRIEFARGRFRYVDYGVLQRYYVRFFDHPGAHVCLQDAGYEILTSRTDGYLPLPGIRRLAPGLCGSLDRWAATTFPGFYGTQFLLVGRPRPTSGDSPR